MNPRWHRWAPVVALGAIMLLVSGAVVGTFAVLATKIGVCYGECSPEVRRDLPRLMAALLAVGIVGLVASIVAVIAARTPTVLRWVLLASTALAAVATITVQIVYFRRI